MEGIQLSEGKIKVVYILSSGHSGSTILDMVLGSHPNLVGMGECERVADCIDKGMLCACEELVQECPFWQVRKNVEPDYIKSSCLRLERTRLRFLLGINIYYLINGSGEKVGGNFVQKYRDSSIALYKQALKKEGIVAVIDSSKNFNRAEFLSYEKEIEVLVIHLVRDLRGVTYSYWKKYGKYYRPMYRWVLDNLSIVLVSKRIGAKRMVITYEDFATNPSKICEDVTKSLGLPENKTKADFSHIEPQHQIAGNRVRFVGVKEIKLDLSWKDKLPGRVKIIAWLIKATIMFFIKVFDR